MEILDAVAAELGRTLASLASRTRSVVLSQNERLTTGAS